LLGLHYGIIYRKWIPMRSTNERDTQQHICRSTAGDRRVERQLAKRIAERDETLAQ
jgi:hypothetical protein